MAAKVLSINARREQQISCCAMDNHPLNEISKEDGQPVFPIFKTAAILSALFLGIGFLLFMFKGPGLMLLFYILGGDFCC